MEHGCHLRTDQSPQKLTMQPQCETQSNKNTITQGTKASHTTST